MTSDGAEPSVFEVVPLDAEVAGAVDLGCRPPSARVRSLAAEGRRVLVRCPPWEPTEAPGSQEVAEVAVYAWLGARVFATAHPAAARQALDMVASVLGMRPPLAARRGLA